MEELEEEKFSVSEEYDSEFLSGGAVSGSDYNAEFFNADRTAEGGELNFEFLNAEPIDDSVDYNAEFFSAEAVRENKYKISPEYLAAFLKWAVLAATVGVASGFIGTLFHKSIEMANEYRLEHGWVIWLLPIGGLAIAALYKLHHLHESTGTNQVIEAVHSNERLPVIMGPLIFISTVITHLVGGSAGREGAALQLGSSIGAFLGRRLHLDDKDMNLITLCGMSGVFTALFGTPLTATFFSLEVISVGVIHYSGLMPCIVSSLSAFGISLLLGAEPVKFSLGFVPGLSLPAVMETGVLALLCAGLSIVFCVLMHKTRHFMVKKLQNDFARVFVGGCMILGLTLLLNTVDYNGAGMNIVGNAINGSAKPEAFVWKMIFTAITIGTGYKGGEIVPTFFIGATFGCVVGGLLGLDPGFAAALGLVALFCAVVNSPVTSILLSIELFGAEGIIFFALAVCVSYMMSGYYGLYSSQKILYSKIRTEFINIKAR